MTADICAVRCERTATLGLLCIEHGTRLADHYGAREGLGTPGRIIHGLPWMYDHIQLAYPSLAGWSGGNRDSGDIDDAEAEKLSAVMALRTEIRDHLTITACELAEDIGRKPPDLAISQRVAVVRSAAWLVAHIEPLRAAQGARATEVACHAAGRAAAKQYYEDNGLGDVPAMAKIPPSIITDAMNAAHAAAKAECVRALLEEADGLASRAHALAPWREAPTRIDGIPCRCGSVGTIHDFGDTRRCIRCGASYDELHWKALMKVLAHRFSDQEGQTA